LIGGDLMRYDAPFLVKRWAPIMGRPDGPRRISVVYQAYTLETAMHEATYENDRHRRQLVRLGPAAHWIERRGAPASRRR
jgi:hypothetical protein